MVSGGGVSISPNTASGLISTVSGGAGNTASGVESSIGGGNGNSAIGLGSNISGGFSNTASSDDSTVGGGSNNTASGLNSAVGGGSDNTASGIVGTVSGGSFNIASGFRSTVGGGRSNIAFGDRSTISGGELNIADNLFTTVSGGLENVATGDKSTVGGGGNNIASGEQSTVGGGDDNIASGVESTVGGGGGNRAGSLGTVGGGSSNFADDRATVSGGSSNTASGQLSTVSGGFDNCAGGLRSWAGGSRAKVRPGSSSGPTGFGCSGVGTNGTTGDQGTFVWADTQSADFVSTGIRQFLVRAQGGVGINTNSPTFILTVNGSAGKPGGGSWSVFSDARLKQNIEPLADASSTLERLLTLKGYEFDYSDAAIEDSRGLPGRQIGLIAQEVREVFPDWVETTDDGYMYVTERGTTALFVEALRELRAEKDMAVARLQEENAVLRQQLASVESRNIELGASLAELRQQQNDDLTAMRAELALLHELVAPQVAAAGDQR